jgi:hypothetical protein
MKVTRDIVADLWPLVADGSASADSRALVEEYLRQDPEWARTLEQTARAAGDLPAPSFQADQEVKMLNRIKWRARLPRWMLLFAMIFTFLAFGRIIQDTQWVASPKRFVATAIVAGICWLVWMIATLRLQRLGP